LFLGMALPLYAAGTSSSTWERNTSEENPAVSLYDQGVTAHKNGDFQKALALFNQALTQDWNNPDILNMLAHTQLKLGMIDEALDNYKKALSIRPQFPEAREYLGEAYVQAALREIKTLKDYGSSGVQQAEDLTKVFKDAAAGLE
jgi:tetratricopeptide (TPR) repeat protein